jgi:hypothetical protein
MAKYYVESGQVRVVFDAQDATEAAVRAFQWSCDKQAGIEAESPLEHVGETRRVAGNWMIRSGSANWALDVTMPWCWTRWKSWRPGWAACFPGWGRT